MKEQEHQQQQQKQQFPAVEPGGSRDPANFVPSIADSGRCILGAAREFEAAEKRRSAAPSIGKLDNGWEQKENFSHDDVESSTESSCNVWNSASDSVSRLKESRRGAWMAEKAEAAVWRCLFLRSGEAEQKSEVLTGMRGASIQATERPLFARSSLLLGSARLGLLLGDFPGISSHPTRASEHSEKLSSYNPLAQLWRRLNGIGV